MGLLDDTGVTASGVVQTLKCGNPDCNNVVAQAHVLGPGIFRILDCPACRRGTEFESTTRGWTVRLLPQRPVQRQPPVPRTLAPHLTGVKR
jgi:hypothetical protein